MLKADDTFIFCQILKYGIFTITINNISFVDLHRIGAASLAFICLLAAKSGIPD